MKVAYSTISSNTGTSAGGIGNYYSGEVTISNSTISDNSSSSSSSAIFVSSGLVSLLFCTVAHSVEKTGILVTSSFYSDEDHEGSLILKNTIIATPIVIDPNAVHSTVQSEGYNLVERVNSAFFQQSSDRVIQDPSAVFAGGIPHLANNGGPTQTVALRSNPDNPAYNVIPVDICHIPEIQDAQTHTYMDQRGMPRPGRGKDQCSIGAYEVS